MDVEESALVCCKCYAVGRGARVGWCEETVPLGKAGDPRGVDDSFFYCYCASHLELCVG
jgi:hypothetical protein